jgi:response regulator RpfG family c-di-GMP phosphodiesterase
MLKVLYVDDEKFNLLVFKNSIIGDYDIQIAESGEKALSILDEQKGIQVVISDMRMPAMNGMQFIKKAKLKHPDVSYYLLTGFDTNEEIDEALHEGLVVDIFHKPFDINEIQNVLNRHL